LQPIDPNFVCFARFVAKGFLTTKDTKVQPYKRWLIRPLADSKEGNHDSRKGAKDAKGNSE